MNRCPNCLSSYSENANFCRNCGALLRTDSGHLSPGTILQNHYQVIKKLGESVVGRVYLATDDAGRKYAIKQVREQQKYNDSFDKDHLYQIVQREANILSSLPHPYLPIARDFIVSKDSMLIVMDYIEGQTLHQLLDETPDPLPEKQVIQWAIKICDALAYLHSKNPPIIHRNILPKNLILETRKEDNVRLLGFGLARRYIPGLEHDEEIICTPGYSPPEQYGIAQTDARSDIFGLGATIFNLLTNLDPGDFVTFHADQIAELNFPDITSINIQLSQRTNQIVQKALAFNPDDRFKTAQEMKNALEDSLTELIHPESKKFILGKPVEMEETRDCEFKEIRGSNPIRSMSRNVERYMVAYLNGSSGSIYWGIRDADRVVVGVKLDYNERDQTRRMITDQANHIQPAVSPSDYRIEFYPVLDENHAVEDLFVIELYVRKPPTNLLYFTGAGEVFIKTEAGKKKLNGLAIQDEIIRRLGRSQGFDK